MADDPGDTELPTARFGRFELAQRLDTGGMAEIFLALERGLHGFERVVVIKQVLPHLLQKASFREMFLQEARWVARLNHPNIVQVYELGDAEGAPFIAMEHVPGVSFRDLVSTALRRKEQIPVGVATGLMIQACAGAHAAHELTDAQGQWLGLVHRDISPQNLMVTGGGHVKLLDFGIAKATELGVETTRTGALKGKVHFMSPEQVQQHPLDRRSDVFALGIVAWEMLTLRRLFKRENDLATMQAISAGKVPRPELARAEIRPSLSAAVMRSLEVDRDRRYATAEEFRHGLEAAADAAGLRWGTDEVAGWVRDVMGEELQARAQAVLDAVERAQREGFAPDAPARQRTASQTLPSFTPSRPPTEVETRDMGTPPSASPPSAPLPPQERPKWTKLALGAA
ncbi:MAG: serine/threonine protein kinase, partial [Deltaproteobacteria bacterium]|nr:serine/threonine protein kinase [Deltaproteobacteria bacterium]